MIGLQHYLILAAVLFVCGMLTMLLKRNAIGILMGVELILNAANVNLVAFNRFSYAGTLRSAAAGWADLCDVCDRAGGRGGGGGAGDLSELLQQLRHDRRRAGARI